jgi:hypothetical protein
MSSIEWRFVFTFHWYAIINKRTLEIAEDNISCFQFFLKAGKESFAVVHRKIIGGVCGTHHDIPYSDDGDKIVGRRTFLLD